MDVNGHRVGALVLSGTLALIAVSCASAPPKQEQKWPSATRSDWDHKDDPCKDKDGSPKQCTVADDCCKGYFCSLDPERSRITHYCLEG